MPGFFVLRIKARLLLVCGLILLMIAASWTRTRVATVTAEEAALATYLAGRVVAIDPGHGGPDPGASSATQLHEKDVVLAIGLHLRDLFTAAGAEVHMTREDDSDLSGMPDASLRERWRAAHRRRVEIVQKSGADVAISVHANAVSSPRWSGAQTFHAPAAGEETRRLAAHIQRELRHITRGTNRQVSDHVNHYMLTRVHMPAVVVEVGFLSNPQEAELLAQASYQRKLAWAMFVGTARYFAERELPGTNAKP